MTAAFPTTAAPADTKGMMMDDITQQDEQAPYCYECGSEDMAYLEQYANGSEYKCRVCGTCKVWNWPRKD
jgi:hypothetical protein